MSEYNVYPVSRGAHEPVRMGFVESNADTERRGLADYLAAVTREAGGWARFYVLTVTPEGAAFPGVPLWMGPWNCLSEEILPMEAA